MLASLQVPVPTISAGLGARKPESAQCWQAKKRVAQTPLDCRRTQTHCGSACSSHLRWCESGAFRIETVLRVVNLDLFLAADVQDCSRLMLGSCSELPSQPGHRKSVTGQRLCSKQRCLVGSMDCVCCPVTAPIYSRFLRL